MSPIAERVAKGAALLDERRRGWWQQIDLETFNITSACRCVLGQVFAEAAEAGGYDDGFDYGTDVLDGDPCDLGFDVPAGAEGAEYPPLEAEWKRLILARREPAAVAL